MAKHVVRYLGPFTVIDDYCYSAKDHYHVYVIWDGWESYPAETRAEMIMDACYASDSKRAQFILQCTGLTTKEAKKRGVIQ